LSLLVEGMIAQKESIIIYTETGRSAGNADAACSPNNRFYYNPQAPSLKSSTAFGNPNGYSVTQVRPNDGIISGTTSSYNPCF
jgi:hypothetical protein